MDSQRPWVIFDADNTLWRVEMLYDEARSDFCAYLENEFGVDKQLAEDHQQRRDRELFQTYGYSACRFPRSFEDTLLHFTPDASPTAVRHARRIASEVFDRKADTFEGVGETLAQLETQFYLGLITSGEVWVQEKRLREFDFRGYFKSIYVVERKSANVFGEFCKKHNVPIDSSWLVGDSIRSDILPGHAVGLNTILILHHNWTPVESLGHKMPSSTHVIESIPETLNILRNEVYSSTSRRGE